MYQGNLKKRYRNHSQTYHDWGRDRNLTRRDDGIPVTKKGKMMHRIHGNSA